MSSLTRETYDLLEEPTGETYRQLLHHSEGYCDVILLVMRHEPVELSACQVVERLRPFLINESEECEWPGTRTVDSATIYRFALSAESITIVSEVASRLYSWVHPNLPEDLCFIRPDGEPWLVTIAHEQDAYLNLTRQEMEDLAAMVPSLVVRPHRAGASDS